MKISASGAIALAITALSIFIGYYIYSTRGIEDMLFYVLGIFVLSVVLTGFLKLFRGQ